MSALVRQVSRAVTCGAICHAEVEEGGGSTSAARTGGPAVTPGTTTTGCRAGAGERSDAANQIPGVPVASLTLEQLMEAVLGPYI